MKRYVILLIALFFMAAIASAGPPASPPVGPNTDLTVKSVSAGLSIHTAIASTPASPLTAADIDGGIIPLSGDGTTVILPAVSTLSATGKFVTIYVTDATAKHIDTNANDKITLRGTALDDGDKLSIAVSSSGTMITLYYLDATGWVAPVGTSYNATDGGA